ncbi:MAG: cation:proton antiporter [Spirochaetales bacterium]|nr:cation:proton antiporter [Spirochaetales bacterium]
MDALLTDLIALRDLVSHHGLFSTGMLLILGYFLGKLANRVKLPEITGYIVAGLVLGDAALGIVHHEMSESLQIVTDVALGLIALTIGGEFSFSKLKRMGSEVVIITVAQILLTFIAVSLGLWLFKMPMPFAMMLGAIATATAPAATVAIVQSLRAHGPFVDRLYGIVALDDAGAVIIFGIVFAIVSSILGADSAAAATGAVEVARHGGGGMIMIWGAIKEILFSIVLGGVAGYIIHRLSGKKNHTGELMIIALGWIFVLTALSIAFHLSPLLSNMAAGMVLINASPRNHRIFRNLEPLTPPIYALFFAIAGTELNPAILLQGDILILGLVFIVARAIGKVGGVWSGAVIAKSKPSIRQNLGYCMLPQAGVAIGLVLMIQASPLVASLGPAQKEIIFTMVNIILLSVFFNELTGPPISKAAIVKALDMEEHEKAMEAA